MEAHKQLLGSLCRLCATKLKEREKSRPKYAVERDLKLCFSLNIDSDENDVHPDLLCHSCSLKMSRWRKKKNQNKEAKPPSIEIFKFEKHSEDCRLCANRQWETDAIHGMCREKNCFCWIVEEKVICVFHDNLGERVVKRIIFEDGNFNVYLLGKPVTISYRTPVELVDYVKTLTICTGNNSFPEIARENCDGMYGVGGELVASVEEDYFDGKVMVHDLTIRHKKCELIANTSSGLCSVCNIYKGTLHAKKSIAKKGKGKGKGKYTRHDYLTKEELAEKATALQYEKKLISQRMRSVSNKVQKLMDEKSISIAEDDANIIEDLVSECATELEGVLQNGSHCQLLWQEQLKANKTTPKQMRWHPAIIKWAIAIHSKSSSAYTALRNSGFLRLPHPNTLNNYIHFTDPCTGINVELLSNYMKDLKLLERPDHEKNINLIFDEMKVQSGLAFSKRTGRIIGFVDVGDVSAMMKEFEKMCTDGSEGDPDMSSHVLLFMARGITSDIKFPVAYFGTNNVTATQLYPTAMDCIEALHFMGLNVKCLTSDGAASNRKFYEILAGGKEGDIPRFKARNCYTEQDNLYFICDVPHLMKTTRNNFENSGWNRNTRSLMYKGKKIAWTHLLQLHEWDQGAHRPTPGLQLIPKLSYEHLHLTPSLRMKVKLAVQVLSATVARALQSMGKPEMESTIHFIEMINKCFDLLNVANPHLWQKKRNPDLRPFTSVEDPRFNWLIDEFLGFLEEWRSEAQAIPDLTKKERLKLCLSPETQTGFFITVHSFVELTKELLKMDGVEYVLSDKYNQDPIEEFFGKQRGAGGFHDNPTVEQFGHHMLQNVVAGSRAVASSRGNVRSGATSSEDISDEPLPKRKRTHKSL